MSFVPPDGVPEMLPDDETMNGQVEPYPFEDVEPAYQALVDAVRVGAENAAAAENPEIYERFGKGCLSFAQALSELLPAKPDPAAQIKAEADIVKAGGQQAVELERLEAAEKGSRDGNGNSSSGK